MLLCKQVSVEKSKSTVHCLQMECHAQWQASNLFHRIHGFTILVSFMVENLQKSRNFVFCQMRLALRSSILGMVWFGLIGMCICVFVCVRTVVKMTINHRMNANYLRCVPLSHVAHDVTLNSTAYQDNNQKL